MATGKTKRRRGVSLYSPEAADAVAEAVAAGKPLLVAAQAVGVIPATVHAWARRHPEFAERLEAAKASSPRAVLGRAGSKYTPELADKILQQIAEGRTLREAARDAGVDWSTVIRWGRVHEEFEQRLDAARRMSARALEDLALGSTLSIINCEVGQSVARGVSEGLKSLRWICAHRDPSRYGDQRQIGQGGIQVIINTNLSMDGEERPEDDGRLVSGIYTARVGAQEVEEPAAKAPSRRPRLRYEGADDGDV